FDLHLGCCERGEPVEVQAVVAEGAVEALDEAVLHRFAGLHEVDLDATGIRPGVERPARELRTVVGNDHVGETSLAPQALEHLNDPHSWQRMRNLDRQAFARQLVADVQAAEATSAGQRVAHEIRAPPLVRSLEFRSYRPRDRRPLALPPSAYREVLEPIGSLHTLSVYDPSTLTQPVMDEAISPARLLPRDLTNGR